MTRTRLHAAALKILRSGLRAVEPGRLVRRHLRRDGSTIHAAGVDYAPRRLFMVAVGKAAVPMAQAAHRLLGPLITSAIVISPHTPPRMPRTLGFGAGHPVPDGAGVRGGRAVMKQLAMASEGDLVLLLLSGGASSLMPAPIQGVSLRDKQKLTRRLLLQGASIQELNAVRKSLSRLKGGGFARLAYPAEVVALAISDVPGDDPAVIGSGPCFFEAGDAALARRVLKKGLRADQVPDGVQRALNQRRLEPISGNSRTVVIGSGRTFAQAAGKKASELGFRVHLQPDALHGEARLCGPNLVARFGALGPEGPHCLIATGETVVRVRGRGRGGRNQELALAAVPSLAELQAPTVLAAFATDGVDGPSGASGGIVDDQTHALAREAGVSISKALERNNSHPALRRLKALLVTGPTGTNVADVAVLVG